MDKNKLIREFQEKKENYNRLGNNIVEALRTFLKEADIPFLEIYSRVKKFDSFYEKTKRKGYKNPFIDIEDICGVRIICYYASDIKRIDEIIRKEFLVIEQEDKSDLLGLKEFAYRSNHYIVTINDSWLAAPNYRKLKGLKAEIQTRTVLMHAWAEVEHKLNYKSDAQVPDKFQRKLFRLSAKFEEADEQFEELRIGIQEYKETINDNIAKSNSFNLKQDFNLETFKAYIKYKFPDDSENWKEDDFSLFFDNFDEDGENFVSIEKTIEKMQPHYEQIHKDLVTHKYEGFDLPKTLLLTWFSLYVTNPKRKGELEFDESAWDIVLKKWIEKKL
ncbi:GTP pyrophosphokinase [Flavivirga eckloniae]|nr:(p)ppGpp synthetase [Flavivirga eckloniae]